MSEQIERSHVRRGDNDALTPRMRFAQQREVRGGEGHQRDQLFRREMAKSKQFAKVSGRHAKDVPRHRFQRWPGRSWSQNLPDVGDHVCAVDRRRPDPEIAGPVGEPVAETIRHPGDDAGDDVGDADSQLVAQLARPLSPEAVAGTPQDARDGRLQRHGGRVALVGIGDGSGGLSSHARIIAQAGLRLPGRRVGLQRECRASHRTPPATHGSGSGRSPARR
jgi:hypothetical protein